MINTDLDLGKDLEKSLQEKSLSLLKYIEHIHNELHADLNPRPGNIEHQSPLSPDGERYISFLRSLLQKS